MAKDKWSDNDDLHLGIPEEFIIKAVQYKKGL